MLFASIWSSVFKGETTISAVLKLSKWHVTSVCQGPSSLALWGGKMRDPENEVEAVSMLKDDG